MEYRIAHAVVGALWLVCGIGITFNPWLPAVGEQWTVILGCTLAGFGGALVIDALRPDRALKPGGTRHGNGREASRGDVVRLLVVGLTVLATGIGATMWGVAAGEDAMTCVGVAVLGVLVFQAPHIADWIDSGSPSS
ncbi:hypothetical protein AB0K11_09170 [Mycobacterium sp. NPDC050551]|uniref:hypothetical protein n=1 Tax=Mycobacterium sp. NPDC050551 TaxID=3155407 RepID=UPI003449B17D